MNNLKIGDIFYEEEYAYKVTGIVPEGYLAERITETNVKSSDLPKTEMAQPSHLEDTTPKNYKESVIFTKTQVNRMPNAELEKLCKELGIEVGTGTEMKRAIIAKLGL